MWRNSAISISRIRFGGISCLRIGFRRQTFALLTILRKFRMEQTNLSICRLVQNWIPQAIRDKIDLEGEILAKIAYCLL